MKHLFLAIVLASGCAGSSVVEKAKECPPVPDPVVIRDTVYIPGPTRIVQMPCSYDSMIRRYDSLRIVADTVARRLLHSRLIISNVRYYLNITLRNPSQDKFLKGWIRRALE